MILANKSPNQVLKDFRFLDTATQNFDFLVMLNRPVDVQMGDAFFRNAKQLVLADGAANEFPKLKLDIKPAFIIGDLDSIEPGKKQEYLKAEVPFHAEPSQDNTDYEKAMINVMSQTN